MSKPIVPTITDDLIAELEARTVRWEDECYITVKNSDLCALLAERAEYRRLLLEQEQIMQSLRDSECALMNEVAGLKCAQQHYDCAIEGLILGSQELRAKINGMRAENAELAKDAERYRWLCNGHGYFMEENMLCNLSNDKPEADNTIDAAMQEQTS